MFVLSYHAQVLPYKPGWVPDLVLILWFGGYITLLHTVLGPLSWLWTITMSVFLATKHLHPQRWMHAVWPLLFLVSSSRVLWDVDVALRHEHHVDYYPT